MTKTLTIKKTLYTSMTAVALLGAGAASTGVSLMSNTDAQTVHADSAPVWQDKEGTHTLHKDRGYWTDGAYPYTVANIKIVDDTTGKTIATPYNNEVVPLDTWLGDFLPLRWDSTGFEFVSGVNESGFVDVTSGETNVTIHVKSTSTDPGEKDDGHGGDIIGGGVDTGDVDENGNANVTVDPDVNGGKDDSTGTDQGEVEEPEASSMKVVFFTQNEDGTQATVKTVTLTGVKGDTKTAVAPDGYTLVGNNVFTLGNTETGYVEVKKQAADTEAPKQEKHTDTINFIEGQGQLATIVKTVTKTGVEGQKYSIDDDIPEGYKVVDQSDLKPIGSEDAMYYIFVQKITDTNKGDGETEKPDTDEGHQEVKPDTDEGHQEVKPDTDEGHQEVKPNTDEGQQEVKPGHDGQNTDDGVRPDGNKPAGNAGSPAGSEDAKNAANGNLAAGLGANTSGHQNAANGTPVAAVAGAKAPAANTPKADATGSNTTPNSDKKLAQLGDASSNLGIMGSIVLAFTALLGINYKKRRN